MLFDYSNHTTAIFFFVDSHKFERKEVVYHAKTNVAQIQGQGQAFSRSRPRSMPEIFVAQGGVLGGSRTVFDDPILVTGWNTVLFASALLTCGRDVMRRAVHTVMHGITIYCLLRS